MSTAAAKKATAKLGTAWEIPATERITILRPDGVTVQVDPVAGIALHVLNLPGEYVAGDLTVTAK